MQGELSRRGGWKRLFPCADRRYKQFFEVDRYFNRLLREYEGYEEENRTAHRSVLNDRQRTSIAKPRDPKQSYNSVNERGKRGNSREKQANFSIRLQQKQPTKRVYL